MRTGTLTYSMLWLVSACTAGEEERNVDEQNEHVARSEQGNETEPETDIGSDLDCEADWEHHGSETCMPRAIECGDTITARIGDGNSFFDDEIYVSKFCGTHENYGGAEAIYTLLLPERTEAIISLDTSCADLDLVALRWEETDRCPGISDRITTCEMDQIHETAEIKIQTINRPERHLVVVDGPAADNDAFQLQVACR